MKRPLLAIPFIALIIIVALALLLGFQQEDGREEGQLVVGFVELLSESSWRDRVAQSIAEAAEAAGVQLITVESDRTQDGQIAAIRKLITYQVDAVVFSPVVMSGWDNVLSETQAAGIPVILTERTIKTEMKAAVAAYVGTDYEAQGRAAALFLRKAFPGRIAPVNVMELTGTVGSSSNADRSRGIRSVLNQDARFDIFYSLSCDQMYSKAKETMEIYLNNNKHPDVLICYNDAMTLGAIEAMEHYGIRPGREILLVSFDAQQDAVDQLLEGKINCLVETNPNVGPEIMRMAGLVSESRSGEAVYLEGAIYMAGDTEIPPRGY